MEIFTPFSALFALSRAIRVGTGFGTNPLLAESGICNSAGPHLAGSGAQMAKCCSRPSIHLGSGAIALAAH